MELGQIDEFLVHDVAHQTDAVFGVVVIDVTIDAVFVDVLREQFADDEEDLWASGIERESARICHHATVDGSGEMPAEVFETVELPDDTEHELTGATGLGEGDGEHSGHGGIEMVVDEHLRGQGTDKGCLHLVDATGGVVVETEHEVGNLEEHVALLAMTVVANDLLRVGHPLQEVGILVGHNDGRLLAAHAQIFGPAQTRADGIAIGTLVAGDEYVRATINQRLKLTDLHFVQDVYVHIFMCLQLTVYSLQMICWQALSPSNVIICKP